jgi:hypothetical protein
MRSPRIFINYRHAESAFYAGRLYEQLEAPFGSQVVFIDTEGIQPGRDYMEVIEEKIRSCKILIAVIGRQWLTCSVEGGRRLDDPEDVVRVEIAEALKQGVRVIPILIQGAAMPRERDLPGELAPLARKQAWPLNDDYWRHDVERLIKRIEEDVTPQAGEASEVATPGTYLPALKKETEQFILGGGALLVLIVMLFAGPYIGPYVYREQVIGNPSEIEQAMDGGQCAYECYKFTCRDVSNRMVNKKVTALEVELKVKTPKDNPDSKPIIVPNRLVLDPNSSGETGILSSYSVLLNFDAKTASVEINRVTRIVMVDSK